MTTRTSRAPPKFQTNLQNLVSGLTSSPPRTTSSLTVGGSVITLADLLTKLKAILILFTAVTTAKQAYVAAVAARVAAMASAQVLYKNVVAALEQLLGTSNPALLATYGIELPKPRKQASVEAKTVAKAKALATRKARGTLGKKQKLAITATAQPTVQVVGLSGASLSPTPPSVVSAAPGVSTATPIASSPTPTTPVAPSSPSPAAQ